MEGYPTVVGVFNLAVAPPVPELVMSYEERRALSIARCRGKEKTPGRSRRWRREVQTKQSLAWLAALQAGERVPCGRARLAFTLRELTQDYIPSCPRGLLRVREQARRLVALALAHGPASGWGKAQPIREGAAGIHATPWWVPKASEKCWRWWRQVVLHLASLLALIARWLLSVVPLHRPPLGTGPNGEEAESRAAYDREAVTGCRDQAAPGVGVAPLWLRTVLGM
ncbi:MAG TPA: hypothetical protein VK547_06595 [Candidatus Udaeobacter sp.]|nr:hypothetical protein [Candidatus Udaeobacter sp.]